MARRLASISSRLRRRTSSSSRRSHAMRPAHRGGARSCCACLGVRRGHGHRKRRGSVGECRRKGIRNRCGAHWCVCHGHATCCR
jgi:hypothetical protein